MVVVTQRIAEAETRGIVAHLRGCVPDLFRASERPTLGEVFMHVRVKNL